MSEETENPYKPLSLPPDRGPVKSTPLRRIVGSLAMVTAAYFSAVWLNAIGHIVSQGRRGRFDLDASDENIAALICLPIVLPVGWAAWKLLKRRSGLTEWLALATGLAILAAGVVCFP